MREPTRLRLANLDLRILLRSWRRLTYWVHAALSGPIWRLYWNPTPGAWVVWRDRRYELTPDRWTLISPQTVFATGHAGPVEHFFIHFGLGPHYRVREPGVFRGALDRTEAALFRRLAARARAEVPAEAGDGFAAHWLVLRILSRLPAGGWRPVVSDGRVRHALALIEGNLRRPPSNEELAAELHLHPASLVRLFRLELGVTPQRYALRARLDRACEQLLHTDASVKTVADTWGFSDRFHLTRAMHIHLQTTPGRLRHRVT